MSQHEEYTMPPGLRVSGGAGGNTKLAPVLIDPTTPPTIGDTLVWNGTVWTADAPSGGGSGVLRASGKIAHAALLTLLTAPVTLVAAQGANTVIVPHRVTLLRSIATDQEYTGIDADAVMVIGLVETYVVGAGADIALMAQLVNGNGTGRADVSALLGMGGGIVLHSLVPDAAWNGDWPGMVGGSVISATARDKPLQFFLMNSPLGVPTNLGGGNAANSLCWTVWYSVVSTDPATYS